MDNCRINLSSTSPIINAQILKIKNIYATINKFPLKQKTRIIDSETIINFQSLRAKKRNLGIRLYRMSQEERTKLREGVPYVKVYRYNPKHLYPKLSGYGDNGKRSLKLRQLLHTYWLPNSYWNWQEYVVSVMLISVLNIKVICGWHKAIKLNYKNTHIHITVFLRVTKHCTYRQ